MSVLQFNVLHGFAFAIHIVSCILAFIAINGSKHISLTQIVIKDKIPSIQDIGTSYSPILLIALNELCTAISHLIALVIINNNKPEYEDDDDYRQYSRDLELTRRIIEYSITALLLEIAIALSLGITSIYVIVLLNFSNIALQSNALIIENVFCINVPNF